MTNKLLATTFLKAHTLSAHAYPVRATDECAQYDAFLAQEVTLPAIWEHDRSQDDYYVDGLTKVRDWVSQIRSIPLRLQNPSWTDINDRVR